MCDTYVKMCNTEVTKVGLAQLPLNAVLFSIQIFVFTIDLL